MTTTANTTNTTTGRIVKPNAATSKHAEDDLVRRIHRAVGGPSKLSTYDDPATVREVVISALARASHSTAEYARISKGDLTAFERRVVRTVTNRGAAVRSRMRQRKELARLRDELQKKDERLRQLEAALESITKAAVNIHNINNIHNNDTITTSSSINSDIDSMLTNNNNNNNNHNSTNPDIHVDVDLDMDIDIGNAPNLNYNYLCDAQKVEGQLLPPQTHDEHELLNTIPPMAAESVDRVTFASLIDQPGLYHIQHLPQSIFIFHRIHRPLACTL